jgi:hypothetical protein
MSGDAIETIELTVTVQANGIIRRADGYILGRCSYDGPTEENSFSRLKNIAQAQASLAEPVTPRAKLIRDAKALIRALKLPVGGGVAMNQNDVWCWYLHRPEWNAKQMNWEIAGLIHCSPIPVDTLHKWPGDPETSWITLDTPETEASPHPEKGEA